MSTARHHAEWLSLVEVSGPFLSMPVLLRVFPDGLDRFEDERDRKARLHVAWEEWQDSQADRGGDPAIHRAWVRHVLREILELDDELLVEGQGVPASCAVTVAEHGERLQPSLLVVDPPGRPSAGKPRLFVDIVPASQKLDAPLAGRRWKASPATRMMTLLHGSNVRLGLVTNGEHWMLVHAKAGETTSYVSFYASLWFEEALTLRAFHSIAGAKLLFRVVDADTLEALFAESSQNQQEVTDQLGLQTRRAVEVLIQNIDRIDRDRGRTLLAGVDEKQLYEAAVTVMMRLVFLFAAEERKLLLLGDAIYDQHYAVSTLREQLQAVADAHGGEVLQRRYDAWSRLLATFRAVHGGVAHEAMRLPAYGGSLFDPDRFPFLEGRAAGTSYRDAPADPLPIDNLTVLDLLSALQLLQVKLPGGGPAETRRLSFRALDVEQIGHVYEGLLDHTAKRATGPVVSLRGAKNLEPEIELAELERLRRERAPEQLVEYLALETGRSAKAIQRDFEYRIDEHDARHIVTACDNDGGLASRVGPWAGLIRRDTRNLPVIIPAGSVYVTEGTARRSTGTHYTPKSLTEPIVKYTLEPLVYEGPAEGWSRETWRLRTAKELLALRVCDLAMGSGAFLVQACRYLAERVVEAWEQAEKDAGGQLVITPDGELSKADPRERPLSADTEERLAIARRYVADRCLYGVDINPMAVEMAKLSLWLVTLQKDRPFTFVDHALKCGDSLLGVTKIEQIENFTLRDGPVQAVFASAGIREVVEKAAAKRRELESLPSDHYDQIEQKRRLHAEAESATATVRAIGDLLIALELGGDRDYEARRGALAERIRTFLKAGDSKSLTAAARDELGTRRPFHWAVEFPEVMEHGGLDTFIGNPPFMGGTKISTANGADYLRFLARQWSTFKGRADLCALFVLRAFDLLVRGGCAGLVTTNTIAQGDTRETGLEEIIRRGGLLYRAVSSKPWPGQAGVIVSLVHVTTAENKMIEANLDGRTVGQISAFLEPGTSTNSNHALRENERQCYSGSKLDGMGFVLSAEEASSLLQDKRNVDIVFPFIAAEDIASTITKTPRRFAINFFEWTEERASTYSECFAILRDRVFPERQHHSEERTRRHWWRFQRVRTELYEAISSLERVLVLPRHVKYLLVEFSSPRAVFSDGLNIVASSSTGDFALLQSSMHGAWAWNYGSTIKTDLRYTPSDCYDTFPKPRSSDSLCDVGERYYKARTATAQIRQIGLTKLYNRVHDTEDQSSDIGEMRILRAELDHAVAAAYGWTDLDLGHGFHETKQGVRYTISESARRIVLDRLLELNHQRYAEEVKAGLHDKGKSKSKTPKPLSKGPQLGLGLDAPPAVAAASGAPSLDSHAQALLAVLDIAYSPMGKAELLAQAKIPESAWTGAISALKAAGLVEQRGEKRGATYARKRGA